MPGRLFSLCLALSLLLTACQEAPRVVSQDEDPAQAAQIYYEYLIKGQYDDYIATMQSCDSLPQAYKDNLKAILADFSRREKQMRGGITAVSVADKEIAQDTRSAKIYLTLHYHDLTQREVLLSLIKDKEHWRLR